MLLFNILIMLVCFTFISLLIQAGIYVRKLNSPGRTVPGTSVPQRLGPEPDQGQLSVDPSISGSYTGETNWKANIEGPIQLETEVRKILNEISEEDLDLKKLQQVILIGAKHCGAGQRLLFW